MIKYFYLKQQTPTKIETALDSVYRDAFSSFLTVKTWAADFKGRRKIFPTKNAFNNQKL